MVALEVNGAWFKFVGPQCTAGTAEEGLVVDDCRAVQHLVEREGRVVGGATVSCMEANGGHFWGSMDWVMVAPDHRRKGLGRALVSDPKLLLLDEPGAGMNQAEIKILTQLLRVIRDQWGITILLVEHVMKLVMEISDRIDVLNFGVKIAEGKPEEIRTDAGVIEAYLGKEKRIA